MKEMNLDLTFSASTVGNTGEHRKENSRHSSSLKRTNPRLLGLASNGGPTPTLALATNSPAIDKAVNQFCVAFDQRGTNRISPCDIGAFELLSSIPLKPITNVLTLSASTLSTNGQFTISWATGYTNVFLQYNTNIVATNKWVAFTNAGPVEGSNFTFSFTPLGGPSNLFFRLQGITNLTITNIGAPPLPPPPTDTNGPPIPK